MTDEKADGVIYIKKGAKYYRRSFDGSVNVLWFKQDSDIDYTNAFNRAIAYLPITGGTILIPDRFEPYILSDSIITGDKKINFLMGACQINLPNGKHGFILQSNGCTFKGLGRGISILKIGSSNVIYPTLTPTVLDGVLSNVTVSGGSGIISTPIIQVSNSDNTTSYDAGIVASMSNGSISVVVVEGGNNYTAPTFNILGGGSAAIYVDNIQGADLDGFSVDFSNQIGSIGVYHRGGWWANIRNIDAKYNNTNGVRTESATSFLLLIDSYTKGVPGNTGGYGGVYVSNYANLSGLKLAVVGHDTSTATTLQFNTCDFQNRYYHAVVGVTEINAVCQADSGSFFDLINVDSLTLIGGDLEGSATWIRSIGSCENIKFLNTLAYSASGLKYRGKLGSGWEFNVAKTNSTEEKFISGSGGSSGVSYQNTGWKIKHRSGIQFSGDNFTIASSNLKMISATEGNLDDISTSGFAMTITPYGEIKIYYCDAGTNPRTLNMLGKWNTNSFDTHSYKVDGLQVLTERQAALPADATDLTTAITLVNAIADRLVTHGLVDA